MSNASNLSSDLASEIEARIVRAFTSARDPEQAERMAAYMRRQFPFLGIASPARVELSRAAVAGLARPTPDDLAVIARTMWARGEREYHYFATWYLRRNVKVLDAAFIHTAHDLIVTKAWWDTVDELAQNIVGPLVLRYPDLVTTMDAWIDDDDIWLARTAILHQNRFRGATDPGRLFRYCRRRCADREFFIRKAIGWALREYSRVDAAAVRRFVVTHDADLSGLSKREALKWLDRRAAREAEP